MKVFIILSMFAAGCVYAASPDAAAAILKSDSEHKPDGDYHYTFETENGISAHAEGHLKQVNKDEVVLEVSGSNHYTAPDGQVIDITYTADENGYHPQGAHLPTPPPPEPIPDYIQRSLEFIAAHPYVEKKEKS